MYTVNILNTLAGKAVQVDDTIVVLSEISYLKKPGFVDTIAYKHEYGIKFETKNSPRYGVLCYKRVSPLNDIEEQALIDEMMPVYNTILEAWTN